MDVHFFGTAAAEGWPAVFCRCDACVRAKQLGGKNIRTRAGAMIGDHIKLDFGPDTYMQALRDGVDLGQVEHVVFTHSHSDHLLASEFEMFVEPYAWGHKAPLHVYGNETVLSLIKPHIAGDQSHQVSLIPVAPFQPFQIGDTTVTPLRADHDRSQTCLLYLFDDGDVRVLWGHDSGYFPPETWNYLEAEAQTNGPCQGIVLDCTNGPLPGMKGHMGIEANLLVQSELIDRGIADSESVFVVTHFSHNGKWMHHELEAALGPNGFLVAYDGWTLTL